jgi:signal transduction histidine kinase
MMNLESLEIAPLDTDTAVTKPLKILILEDSEADLALLKRYLKTSTLSCECFHVETVNEFRSFLESESCGLILSDFNLPGFDALAALHVLHELDLDIPFIVISGALKDTDAAAVMKAGAHDFIPKDNLGRLIPAINREHKEAKIRHERRTLSVQLREAKEFAEQANHRKSRVLAFVAHEFKNPLLAIETFANLMKKSKEAPLSPDQTTHLEAIQLACRHIRELVTDILDIAPIEAGKVELFYEKIAIKPLLDEIVLMLSSNVTLKKITLNLNFPEQGLTIEADGKRLRQILINLLSNAIKYTHREDTISLSLKTEGDWVLFQVKDNGPGIQESELKNLFADYYRVKNVFSKQQEGLGLGLALTKTLTELHGGNIHVESIAGQGCTFTVKLPQYRPSVEDKM